MKKIKNLLALTLSCLMLFSLSACSGDDLDTNQYVGGISLNVFGPCPVARGGELRFLGSGMDKITAIIIPGCGEITDIKVISSREIRITVPQTAEPGLVTLKTPTGEIVTKTELTYSEPISYESMSPMSIRAGQRLTITGEYLNLIKTVIFADDVAVPEEAFITHERKQIVVEVPIEAKTGEIILSDTSIEDEEEGVLPNYIYSEEELTVETATITEVKTATRFKAGETMSIIGTDLDLTAYVKFEGIEIPAADLAEEEEASFTLNEEATEITLTLPAEAASGVLSLVMRSGVEVVAEEDFNVVVPTIIGIGNNAIVKAGLPLAISGLDMDLVTSITFPDEVDGGEFSVQNGTLLQIAAIPEMAVDGDIVLHMANGMSVPVSYELVKPAVTGYSADPVNAGASLTLTGTDLDLVASVSIGGGSAATPDEDPTETSLTITVPMDSQSGTVTLTLKNGTTQEAQELTVNEALFCYATELPGEDAEIKAGSTLTLNVVNIDKLTGVQINRKDCQFIQAENSLIIGIPQSAGAGAQVRLISSNGEITYTINFIPATEVSTVVWSGLTEITWGAGGRVIIPASAFEDVPAGAIMTVCYTQKDQVWAQAQFNYADWSGINFTEGDFIFSQTLVPTDEKMYGWFQDGILNRETPLVLTQEILDNILAKRADCDDENEADCGIIIQGSDLIFTKITLSYTRSLEQDLTNCIVTQADQNVLMPFPIAMTWDDSGRFRILIDKEPSIKDMALVAGKSTMYFYVTGAGQLQINDAGWSEITTLKDEEETSTRVIEMVLTQDMVDCLKGMKSDGWSSTGLVIQGQGFTLSKVTILP